MLAQDPLTGNSDREIPVNRFLTWFSASQIERDEARRLFDYRDGRLFWRDPTGRRRPEAGAEFFRKRFDASPIWTVSIGSRAEVRRYMRRYLVWNWHFGGTDFILAAANGDTLDDRIENIMRTGRLEVEARPAQIPAQDGGHVCPCCGSRTSSLGLDMIIDVFGIPAQRAKILEAVWKGKGHPVPTQRIFDAMYMDDPNGGPSSEKMYSYFKSGLSILRKELRGSGVTIETVEGRRGYRLKIEES